MELRKENAQTLMEHFDGDYQIKEFTNRINMTIESLKGLVEKLNDASDLPGEGIFQAISGQALYIGELGKQLNSMKQIKTISSK